MLEESVPRNECPALLVRTIPDTSCHYHFNARSTVCPAINSFFKEKLYDAQEGLENILIAIPDKVKRVEDAIGMKLEPDNL
eukprot:CAMPEP_0170477846 /NCGR_PEP_ID=MMETSP0123-20130129/19016_1 /TAXON_ID=182087 /ORGANISM="Favella ehrenbergii, Strain Fehren 1" /LENGTH=80 /DNA_ID=CAMNT_0010749803 /DNA_START=346 /DNA_END=588 /DNA_ORIENTATION=-